MDLSAPMVAISSMLMVMLSLGQASTGLALVCREFTQAQSNTLTSMTGETMVPEGLEWQSVEEIVDRIASIGFNFVRL
jgi:hypothetical protein